jgi:Domain of unknown function (DUF4347)/Malectin domain/Kelch motif/Calx-beta domain
VSETPFLNQQFESTFLQLPDASFIAPKTIVFIDRNIADAMAVMDNVQADVKIFLDAAGDGVSQITEILKQYHGLSGIDIISHGDIAELQLGTGLLNTSSLASYGTQLQQWRSALAPEADIIFHGCNVAAGIFGQDFVEEIGNLTGADVAASVDLTGSSALGGDWDLEFATGEIETTLAVRAGLQSSYNAVLHAGQPAVSLPLLPLQTVGTPVARINSGGGAYVDNLGNTWSADQYFVGSSYTYSINQAIAGTNNSPLYQNERSGVNGSSFSYEIPVGPGIYSINLSFAELYWQQAGLRVFDVDIEGQSFLNDFDVFSAVGAKTAVTKSTQVLVTDGFLNINFEAMVENPTVDAIEILKVADVPAAGALAFSAPTFTVNEDGTLVSAVTVTRIGGSSGGVSATLALTEGTAVTPADFSNNPIQINFADGDNAAKTIVIPIVNDTLTESTETIGLTLGNVTGGAILGNQSTATLSILDNDGQAKILINAGGGQYVDTAGQNWLADQYFSGSSYVYSSTTPSITNTNNLALFKNERSGVNGGSFGYQVPVTNGTYTVNLNFAELYWDASGKRIFNVKLEGQTAVQNLDIWAQVGKNTALTKSVQAVVVDGILNIDFASTAGDAEITSIEILRTGNVPTPTAAGTLAFGAPTFTVNEDGTFLSAVTVTRTGGSVGAVSAIVTPTNGTASAPGDYNNASITVSFANGDSTAKTIFIPVVNDTLQERVEGINLTLSNLTGGAVLGTQASATLSIVDNDLSPGFTNINWTTEVPSTEATSESLGAVVDGKVFVFGGFNTDDFVSSTSQRVTVYDPAINAWKRLKDMPTKLTHAPTIVDGNTVYFIGGYDGLHPNNLSTTTVWKYDTVADTWTTFVPLPVPHGAGGAALVTHADNKRYIHFFGGTNYNRTIDTGDHFFLCLDDPNPAWVIAAAMPNPRNHLGGAGIDGKVYAVGGQHKEEFSAMPVNEVDVYDPATNTWTQVASLPTPRSQMGAGTIVWNGRIIVAGGEKAFSTPVASVTAYNPATNTWTELTPLPRATNSGVAGAIGSELIYTTGYDYSRPGQGNFTWSGLALGAPVDTIAPQASLTVTSIITPATSKQFTVTYTDNVAVDVTDLNNFDIRITNAQGFSQLATFVSVNNNTSGTPRTATYQLLGPGGAWDSTDNGLYTVSMEPNQVSDTSNNNFVAAGAIGSFTVNISVPNTLRIEAESMILNTYRVEANASASGGNVVSLKSGGAAETGFANYTFAGLAGNYDVVIGYYDEDETNGDAQFEVKQGNTVLDAWSSNLKLGSVDAVPKTFVRRKIATSIAILPGSIFQLKGIESIGEKARIDYLEFIPV